MKWLALTLYFAFIGLPADDVKHAFHASITSIDYKERKENLQITSKLFTDDLETALQKASGKKISLENNSSAYEKEIANYMFQHFSLKQQSKIQEITFVGYETEFDLTYVYMEISWPANQSEFDIKNTTFFELFNDQSNIVTVHFKEQRKSAFLSQNKPTETIQFTQHE